jgi:hypothetical protein
VQAWCKASGVPLIFCEAGVRKHELAEEHLPRDPQFKGVFLVLASKAPAPRWSVKPCANGQIHLKRDQPWPYIRHFSFHIIDPDWGHLAIKISAHPPFGAQIMLNGHEWVERTARAQGIAVTKEGNCFTEVPDPQALNQLAETLFSSESTGRLAAVCDRWIYSACLCFGLSNEEQERSQFRYIYTVYQLELSRNLLFRRGRELDEVYQGLIDRTRSRLDVKSLKTLFGYLHRPFACKKGKAQPRFELTVEKPAYNLTVFKVHFKRLTLKIYDKGARVLRVEAIAHNTADLRCGKLLERLGEQVQRLCAMAYRFLNVLHCAHVSVLGGEELDELSKPTQRGTRRLAGLDLAQERTRAALEALIALAPQPGGFSIAELADKVRAMTGWDESRYHYRHALYDLAKMRGKRFVERISGTRRQTVVLETLQGVCGILTLREKVIKPLLASLGKGRRGPKPARHGAIDLHYENLQQEMVGMFQTLGIAICEIS